MPPEEYEYVPPYEDTMPDEYMPPEGYTPPEGYMPPDEYMQQMPEPEIAVSLHAVWDPDLTDDKPHVCTTSETVSAPWFHFVAGYKGGTPVSFKIDYVLIEELTEEHEPQVWLFGDLQWTCANLPWALVGCTMPPVADPENWNWFVWDSVSYGGAHREALTGYLAYAGDYTIIVEAQDDYRESNKAHERRWTLPRGSKLFVQSCAHYGFTGFWDWNTDAIANKAYYELGKVVNPVNLRELCYSGWYPIHECGGVLVNKRKDHAIRKISDGLIKGTLLENSIWSWSWHVADEGLMFADETYITYDDIEELPLGSLSAIRLAVLLGCYTWDFADLFVSKGARVVVGFEGTINQVAARFWNGRFWEFLTKEGETVEQAAVKAVEWCWWFPWSGLNTLYIAGNGNETIY
jgi:hypothetical protein